MQSFNEVDMDIAPGSGSDSAGSRLLNSALSSVSANAKKTRSSPYDRRAQDPKDRWQHDKFNEDGPGASTLDRGARSGGGRTTRSSSHNAAHISQKLKIQDLHYEITETELRELFEGVGDLLKAPEIIYDRSGRSTGTAYVVFQRAEDAAVAKREFHQQHAHGEPISISFEPYSGERKGGRREGDSKGFNDHAGGRRGERGDRPQSLLQRVEPTDLLSRMEAANSSSKGSARRPNPPSGAPTGPAASRAVSGGRGGSARSARGPGAGGGSGRNGNSKPGPRTANDLDAELDAFMKTPASASIAQSIHAPGADGDVEMA